MSRTCFFFSRNLLVGFILLAAVANGAFAQHSSNSFLPVITVQATDPDASEAASNVGTNTGTFTIHRLSGTNALVVYYTLGGTASNGVDYIASPSSPGWPWPHAHSVLIPAGANSASITITPRDDNLAEGPETVVLRLGGCPDFAACYRVSGPASAVVVLHDNEPAPTNLPPTITIHANDPLASEPGILAVIDPGLFTIYRSGNTNTTVLAQYAVSGSASNGVDYTAISNAVVIPAGQVSANVVINPLPDNLSEPPETVLLRLLDPCGPVVSRPPECHRLGVPDRDIVFIANAPPPPTNHPPTVHVFTPTNGASFVAPANIFIVAHAQDLDGYLTIQTVEFFAGTNSLGVTTNFPTLDPIGPFKLVWTNVPPGTYVLTAEATDSSGLSGISPPVQVHVVETNHPPTNVLPVVSITAPDALATEGTNWHGWPGWTNHPPTNAGRTNTALFVVRRTGSTDAPLTVHYRVGGTASNGVDFAELPGMVTVLAGRRTAEIRVVPIEDNLLEHIETVVLGLRLPPEATNPLPYVVGFPGRAAAAIVDNDRPRPVTGPLADRSFHIAVPWENDRWFRIESSTDLVNWTLLGTTTVTDGALHFVDPDGDELPQRFYRAVPEVNPPLTE